MNSHRSSHTHCQAPQAQAQTNFCDKREQKQTCLTMPSKAKISEAKACQRVCLPQRTTKTTDKQADEKKHDCLTSVLQNGGFSATMTV